MALAALIGAVLVGTVALSAREARAEIDEAMLRMGSELKTLAGSEREGLRELRINGARFWFRTGSVEAPVDSVLRRHQEACAVANARVFRALGGAIDRTIGRAAAALGELATSTHHDGDRGYVACADFEGSSNEQSLLEEIASSPLVGHLGVLGSLRYVYVERDTSGGQARSFVMVVRASLGSLIERLVPVEGRDAEGRDPAGFPRPPNARRALSAWELDAPSAIFSYITEAHSPAELETFYRTTLPQHGWKPLGRHPAQTVQLGQVRMLAAEKEDRLVTVIAHPASGRQTTLTILASEPP
jgi:hypothetical protein